MDINDILKITDDLKRNDELYKIFDEEKRLESKAGSVEKITTINEIDKLINSKTKVLDIGAATGVYSLYLAEKVDEVVSYEPSSANFSKLDEKISQGNIKNIKAYKKSSMDMGDLASNYFDLVLLFGPMYHLSNEKDRQFTLKQAKRVCKKGGHILIAFINHDMIPMTETKYSPNFMSTDLFDQGKLRVKNTPFIYFTLDECTKMLEKENLKVKERIASDGFSEILADKINQMSEESFSTYLAWHQSHSKNENLLSASNHFLFVCEN